MKMPICKTGPGPGNSRLITGAVVLLLICLIGPAGAAPKADGGSPMETAEVGMSKILVLHSYHYGFTWTDNVSRGIQAVFDDYRDRVELRYEFMDTRRIHSDAYFEEFKKILRFKYRGYQLDAVICSDDHALNFMLSSAPDLFAAAPIVFCSVSGFDPAMATTRKITGVLESIDIKSTLDVALQLQPETKKVAVITDRTRTGQALKVKAERIFSRYEDRLVFRYLEDYTIEELQRELPKLSRDTIIFLFIFNQDKAGRVLSHEDNLEKIAEVAPVPIYSVWRFYLGNGIVGGKLASGETDGRMVAKIALDLLKGRDAADFPLSESPVQYMFDYSQLAKFDLHPRNLPADSLIINRPFSFYQNYKELVWLIIAAFSLCIIIIAALFVILALRRGAELRIKRAQFQQSALLNNIPDLAWLKDREGRFIAANKPFGSLWGVDVDEIAGKTELDCWPKSLAERYKQDDLDVITSAAPTNVEEAIVAKNKKEIIFETIRSPIFDDSGAIVGTTGIARDITLRMETESALRESEEKFRTLVEESPLGIALIEKDGRYKYVNPVFEEMFGYSLEDVPCGAEWFRKAYPDRSYRHTVIRSWKAEMDQPGKAPSQPIIFTVTCNDGKRKDIQFRPVRLGTQQQLVIYEDITEKLELERQFQQFQKFEAIGTLAGGIAHDFNNLLMGIQGRASLVLFDLDPGHPQYEHIKAIEEYVRSATDLTKQLLGFAREGKYEVRPLDINELLRGSAALFGRTKKEIRIHTKVQQPPPVVEADRRQIEQVLLNLYVNAWQAMPEGGELYLETQSVFLDDDYCKSYRAVPGSYAKVSVADTGIGMDESTRRRVFDPFFTTKDKGRGTGMGLASAYGIVKNHGGIITVQSSIGEGSRFDIYLPLSDKQVQPDLPEGAGIAKGSETILLVDDEAMILDVGQALLERLDYRVMVAKDAGQAVEMVRTRGGEIDLVILDLIMPGIKGDRAFDLIREIQPTLPVILSSGYALNGQAEKVMQKGCNGFIQKPFDIIELSQKVRHVLDETPAANDGKS